MGLPELETCCFVFDLKTGNLIMGALNAFLSFIMTVIMIVVAVMLGTEETEVSNAYFEDPEEVAMITGAYALTIILAIMFLAKFIFDVVFLYAVSVERASIIKAYMIMWIVFFLLSMFIFFTNVIHYSALHICFEIFYIGFNVYAILLYHSFYKSLNKREMV